MGNALGMFWGLCFNLGVLQGPSFRDVSVALL